MCERRSELTRKSFLWSCDIEDVSVTFIWSGLAVGFGAMIGLGKMVGLAATAGLFTSEKFGVGGGRWGTGGTEEIWGGTFGTGGGGLDWAICLKLPAVASIGVADTMVISGLNKAE